MKIFIAGDLVPINSNEKPFLSGNLKNHFSDFENDFNSSDLFIVNLESPLTDYNVKTPKSGSSLKANPETINGISQLGVDLLSLANNHIGDYGQKGVKDSLDLIKNHNINSVGSGHNISEARKPYIYEKGGVTVGVLSYADREFGMADNNKAGANPFDFVAAYNDVKGLKEAADYIIILLHDGKEYYPYPSPELQKISRHLVDLGTDLVVCQHSHVVGAVEEYNKGTIVYGQGNFLFDYRNNRTTDWERGFIIEASIEKNKNAIRFLPFKQSYPGISKLSKEEEILFFDTLKSRAKNLLDKKFIEMSWKSFVLDQEANYISAAFGHNTFISRLLKKTGLYKYSVSNKIAMVMLNFLRSRVHRESFISIMEDKTEKDR